MPDYRSPGIYIEELETGARPIEQVGTSTAAFVGLAPRADALRNQAVRIQNFERDFRNIFVQDVVASTPLAQAVQGYFQNGGGVCYVVNLGDDGPISGNGRGLDQLVAIDDIAMIAAPGRTDAASYDALLTYAETYRVFALCDGPEQADDVEALTRVAGLDDETEPRARSGDAHARPGLRARTSDRGFGAYYFPWLRAPDLFARTQDGRAKIVSVPPSGHVAGMCARSDYLRGVHKAPANMMVAGVGGLSQSVSKADQQILNPSGVNCFRWFANDGTLLWGARTLAPAASDWRYVSVRRLFIMIEHSIERGTRWIVFEPNDVRLWKAIRRDITAFLTILWRQGYLMGVEPEQAFFVKCDEDTNPPEVVDAGRVEILVGIAPVKPAEFVIIRIGQSQSGAVIEPA